MGHGRRQKGEEKNEERKEKKKQTHYITVTLGALQALHSNVPSSFPSSSTPLERACLYNFSYSHCLAIGKVDNDSTALEALSTRTKLVER